MRLQDYESRSFGTALSNGETPSIVEAYDPKSLEHILAGTTYIEKDMVARWMLFTKYFLKYATSILGPELIADYNQIFTRDIGFVIDGILLNRIFCLSVKRELDAINM
jgi:hypothetical protein